MTNRIKKTFLFFLALWLGSCGPDDGASGKRLEELPAGKNSTIVRNPVTANGPQDTTNVAKISFEEDMYDFGQVSEGEKVNHVFSFTNTGKVPLVINDVKSTCGCTVPDWPEDPIPPGDSGEISVAFNSYGRTGEQSKPITVFANTYPNQTQVILFGYVEPKNQ